MTQKTEAELEPKTSTDTKNSAAKPSKVQTASPAPTTTSTLDPAQKEPEAAKTPATLQTNTNELSPELIDLVTELRDTVKLINPNKHTAKTLRRALLSVSAILADIDKLYQPS